MVKRDVPRRYERELAAMRREAIELAGLGLCRYALDRTVLLVDGAFLRILGLEERYPDPEAVIGLDVAELFGPETSLPLSKEVEEQGEVRGREQLVCTPQGMEKCLLHDSYLVRDPETGEVAIQAIVRDITQRKMIERALRDSEERFRRLIDTMKEGFGTVDAEGVCTYANTRMAAMLGFEPGELVGRKVMDLVDPGWRFEVERGLGLLSDGVEGHLEVVWRRRDGGEVHTLVSSTPMLDAEGRFAGTFGAVTDITALKLAEDRLRASEERYRAVFESMLDALVLWVAVLEEQTEAGVPDFRFVEVNPAFTSLVGVAAEDVVGRRLAEIGRPGVAPVLAVLQRVLRTGVSERSEAYSQQADRHYDGVVFRPQPGHVAAIFADVTERRRLEAKLRQAAKMEAIGTLAGGVAHEINNPVNIIMNYGELIAREVGPEERAAEFAREIIAESKRIAEIVRSLLAFARSERETYSQAGIRGIVEAAVLLAGKVLTKDQIAMAVELEPDLPDVLCRTQQIQQVVMNLVTNARDSLNERYPGYHEDKTILVTARRVVLSGETFVRTTVEDHGVGIDSAAIERVFDPFFTTKPTGAGTGLGLSVSHGIVEDHGGRLWVESERGTGARFHVDLPAFDPASIAGARPDAGGSRD